MLSALAVSLVLKITGQPPPFKDRLLCFGCSASVDSTLSLPKHQARGGAADSQGNPPWDYATAA